MDNVIHFVRKTGMAPEEYFALMTAPVNYGTFKRLCIAFAAATSAEMPREGPVSFGSVEAFEAVAGAAALSDRPLASWVMETARQTGDMHITEQEAPAYSTRLMQLEQILDAKDVLTNWLVHGDPSQALDVSGAVMYAAAVAKLIYDRGSDTIEFDMQDVVRALHEYDPARHG